MARRKTRLTVADIGRLPLVKMPDQPRPSLRRFQQEEETRITAEQAEERTRQQALERDISKPLHATFREMSERVRRYWKYTSLEDIRINDLDLTPVDLAGDYPIHAGKWRWNQAEFDAAWQAFAARLKSEGVTISIEGLRRLGGYLGSLNFHRNVNFCDVASWALGCQRLFELGCFADGELTGYQPPTVVIEQSPAEPTSVEVDPLAEIETLHLDSRDGNRRAKEISDRDFFGRQMAPIADQWRDWLETTFNYILTDDARKAAGQWWLNNPTENPLMASSWTQLRLNLVKRGVMPASCKTPEEILMETIEASSERGDSYETRRRLRQNIRELAQK